MSVGRTRLPRHALELGTWNIDRLESLMRRLEVEAATAGDRVVAWVDSLTGTPFRFETRLTPLPADTMRVRLASFDCITFAYHVLALAGSQSFGHYLQRLYTLRYVPDGDGTVNDDPRTGNFLDFACEALLVNAVRSGMLVDVSSTVARHVEQVTMTLRPMTRPTLHDPAGSLVVPRYPGLRIDSSVIPASRADVLHAGALREGDLVVFTRGAIGKNGQPQATFVCHVGFVKRVDGVTSMVHATRHYYRCRQPPSQPVETLGDRPDCLLPGVTIAGTFLGDEYAVEYGGHKYHGYDLDRPRDLLDYAANNFPAFKILRPVLP